MSKFKKFSYLLDRWQKRSFEIIEYIPRGLQPYTQNGTKLPCPQKLNQVYITAKEKSHKTKRRLNYLNKIQGACIDVVRYLDDAEAHAEAHYSGSLDKGEPGQVLLYQEYNAQYKKIFDVIGKIRELKVKDSEVCNFLKDSGIDFETLGQPSLKKLYSVSPKENSEFHLSHIRGIKFIYENCDDHRVKAVKELQSIEQKIEQTDWDSWSNFEKPKNDELIAELTNVLQKTIYDIENIQRFEKQEGLEIKKETEQEDEPLIDIAISKDETLEWNQITIRPLNDEELIFQFKESGITRCFEDLGFKDARTKNTTNKPIRAWEDLLEASRNGGRIPYDFKNRKKVEKLAQKLRKIFRTLFPGVKRDPVPIDKKDSSYGFAFVLNPPQK